MANYEIWIRTFNDRLYHAKSLKESCYHCFAKHAKLINTKDKSRLYSERFVFGLQSLLCQSEQTPYTLILEDDMLFSKDARQRVESAIESRYPLMWYSIPSQQVLDCASRITETTYFLKNFNCINYSGAILVKRDLLKGYVTEYLLNCTSYEYRNFDITFSSYIKRTLGGIFLTPKTFATNPSISSAISSADFEVEGRVDVSCRIDPLFEFESAFEST